MKRIFRRLRHSEGGAASGFVSGIALCFALCLASGIASGTALLAGCGALQAPVVRTQAVLSGGETAATGGGEGPEVPAPFRLLLMHVNDTHSKLEPSRVKLSVDLGEPFGRKAVYVELGGFPRVWAAADRVRADSDRADRLKTEPLMAADIGTLFLHAGDAFQGTLYFTRFEGRADAEFFNAMGIDAMALGNHELDKGPLLLGGFLERVRFPVLSANLDFTREPELGPSALKPYVVEDFDGSRVAVIGITTPETPYISSPGPNLVFADQAETAARCVEELERRGVNKIVVLSHLGYREDLELAASVGGIDVIVGGHSHTLLGSFSDLGLPSSGRYPSVVTGPGGDSVLVVTAWEWAKAMGELEVLFDANGRVSDWSGAPRLVAGSEWFCVYDLPGSGGKPVRVEFRKEGEGPNAGDPKIGDPNAAGASPGTASSWSVREYDGSDYTVVPDPEQAARHLDALDRLVYRLESDRRFLLAEAKPEGLEMLERYGAEVQALKKQVVAHAAEDLRRGNNRGPGPLIADSMIAKTGARVAVMNPGGVRTNLSSGSVSVAQVYELQPFGNTLVTLDLTGTDVVKILEDMCDFTVSRYEKSRDTAYAYVAGLRFTLLVNARKGQRVVDVEVRGSGGAYRPLESAGIYKTVVNSFMAAGGDKSDTLKEAPGKYDTGYVDAEATLEYLSGMTLVNRSEERVRQVF